MKCRACELERGYVIEMWGKEMVVSSVTEKKIVIKYTNAKYVFGRNCQMWVRLIRIKSMHQGRDFVKVIQIDKDGYEVERYDSISEAAKRTGILDSSISNVVRGKYKTAGGYIWKRA